MEAGLPNIYQYQSSRQFLLDRVTALQQRDPSLSVRNLARNMGMKSHTLLILLLQGKRPLRVKHAPALAKGLELSSAERLYLQALIQFESAEDLEEKKLCSLWLTDLHPDGTVRTRVLDEFETVSNWIHMAILALSELPDFDPSADAIARRFQGRVTSTEVRAAIERLKTLGLIEFTAGARFKPTYQRVSTPDDVASQGARKYHRQVMELASGALETIPLQNREFQSSAIPVPASKVALAKDMIRKFRAQFERAMEGEPGSEIFQLNIQFFQLTESPERMVRSEDEGVDAGWKPTRNEGAVPC